MATLEEDQHKTKVCITLIYELVTDSTFTIRYPDFSAECRRRLGAGWSLMTIMQWLTGKRAVAAINALSGRFELSGLKGQALIGFHDMAIDFCREHDASAAATADGDRMSVLSMYRNKFQSIH